MDRRVRVKRRRKKKAVTATGDLMLASGIPRVWIFPFGYRVHIKLVTPRTIMAHADGAAVDGLWDGDARRIYIDKTLPMAGQRYTLTHEAVHAVADWQHWVLNSRVGRS